MKRERGKRPYPSAVADARAIEEGSGSDGKTQLEQLNVCFYSSCNRHEINGRCYLHTINESSIFATKPDNKMKRKRRGGGSEERDTWAFISPPGCTEVRNWIFFKWSGSSCSWKLTV